jgi:DNA-directed RNA polymerase I and III subunit RPAC1
MGKEELISKHYLMEFTADDTVTDKNTIVFSLGVECIRNPDAARDETDPSRLYINSSVYSAHLKFQHHGKQYKMFNLPLPKNVEDSDHHMKGDAWGPEPQPTVKDILLVKMRPGQKLNMLCYCVKGVGKDHAKFSPVGTLIISLEKSRSLRANG